MRRQRLIRWSIVTLWSVAVLGAEPPDVRLAEAIKLGHREAARTLLKQRVDVNAIEPDGTTALHWAVRADERDTVLLLIRAGANVRAANRYGVTPIAMAALNANPTMIETLIAAGADANVALPEGETVLMTAARTGSAGAVKALVAHGADVNSKEAWLGQTALMWAVAENHPAASQALIEAGADVNARSALLETKRQPLSTVFRGGFTPLLFAARQGALDAARVLIAAGAHLNEADPDGISPMVMAIINGHYDLAALLLDSGADLTAADKSGRTALHAAVNMHTVEWAPNRPAPKQKDTLDGLDMVKRLLARGADPNVRLKGQVPGRKTDLATDPFQTEGGTPFIRAAKSADVAVLRLLLDKGADTNLTTKNGTTALMAAAGLNWRDVTSRGSETDAIEVIKVCLERGADINAADDAGYTALHGAARRGGDSIVRFLLAHGARLDVKTKAGRTPLDEAFGDDNGKGDEDRHPPRQSTIALLRQLMSGSTTASAPPLP